MLLVLFTAVCLAASVVYAQDCFRYNEIVGGFTKTLGETINDCRDEFAMQQPEEAQCVLWQYGAVDRRTWQLHCKIFANYIDAILIGESRREQMRQYGLKDCGCREDLPLEKRKQFILCWKDAFAKACPEDKELDGGVITSC